MKVHVYTYPDDHPIRQPHVGAVLAGFRAHGIEPELRLNGAPRPCDLAVVWGARRPREAASGTRHMIIDRGYVGDRLGYLSMGYDGFNGRADFCNEHVDGRRWRMKFEHLMWKMREHTPTGYVLLAGQLQYSQSDHGVSITEWISYVVSGFVADRRMVIFRPHPFDNARYLSIDGELVVSRDPLSMDLAVADWVVTLNSNVGVDAVLDGVPTVSCDRGSMVWDITEHDPFHMPVLSDRTDWSHKIAYAQWSPAEIEHGEAWEHLKQGMVNFV